MFINSLDFLLLKYLFCLLDFLIARNPSHILNTSFSWATSISNFFLSGFHLNSLYDVFWWRGVLSVQLDLWWMPFASSFWNPSLQSWQGLRTLGRISPRAPGRTKSLRFRSAWAFLGSRNTNRPASWFPYYQQRSQLFLICYQSPTICSQSYAFQLLNVGAFICFACYLCVCVCVCVSTWAHILLLSPWWVSGAEAINTSSNLCV